MLYQWTMSKLPYGESQIKMQLKPMKFLEASYFVAIKQSRTHKTSQICMKPEQASEGPPISLAGIIS